VAQESFFKALKFDLPETELLMQIILVKLLKLHDTRRLYKRDWVSHGKKIKVKARNPGLPGTPCFQANETGNNLTQGLICRSGRLSLYYLP